MTMVNMVDLEEMGKLKHVVIKWSEKYACPVYILEDGRMYVEYTGEYAGYFEQVAPHNPTNVPEGDEGDENAVD